jgi:hypothetical protein
MPEFFEPVLRLSAESFQFHIFSLPSHEPNVLYFGFLGLKQMRQLAQCCKMNKRNQINTGHKTTLLLPISVNHSICILHDCTGGI